MTNPTEAPMANAIDDVNRVSDKELQSLRDHVGNGGGIDGPDTYAALTELRDRRATDTAQLVIIQPMNTAPHGDDAMEPSEIDVHEGAWAVVIGTNGKTAGWIDTHALFAHQLYRHHILASPAPSQHTGWSDEAVEAALRARVPGGSEVWRWVNGGGMSIDDTHREVMRTILAALSAPSIAPARMPHSGAKVSDIVAMIDADTIAPATGFEVKDLQWSEPAPPTKDVCFYDHCFAESPLGQYRIEWKSWKKYDAFCVYGPCEFFASLSTLDEAKAAAQADFDRRIRSSISPSVAKESGEWQDIATAPKDGRNILIWDADCQSHDVGLWSEVYGVWLNDYSSPPMMPGQDMTANTIFVPTHWQPLPSPPEVAS